MKIWFNQRMSCSFIAIGVGIAIVAVQSLGIAGMPSSGESSSKPADPSVSTSSFLSPSLSSTEAEALESVAKALTAFEDLHRPLSQKGRVSVVELNRLEATATHLKEAIPAAQNALRSIVKDLKAKGKWTSELGTVIEEQMKKSDLELEVRGKLISKLRENGGARAAIEGGPANLRLLRVEVDNDVMRLKRLVAQSGSGSQIRVSATLAPTVPVSLAKMSLGCMVALVVYAVSILIGCKACARAAKEYLLENGCLY